MELLDRLFVTLSELVVHELADDGTLADARRSHNNDPVVLPDLIPRQWPCGNEKNDYQYSLSSVIQDCL